MIVQKIFRAIIKIKKYQTQSLIQTNCSISSGYLSLYIVWLSLISITFALFSGLLFVDFISDSVLKRFYGVMLLAGFCLLFCNRIKS